MNENIKTFKEHTDMLMKEVVNCFYTNGDDEDKIVKNIHQVMANSSYKLKNTTNDKITFEEFIKIIKG